MIYKIIYKRNYKVSLTAINNGLSTWKYSPYLHRLPGLSVLKRSNFLN